MIPRHLRDRVERILQSTAERYQIKPEDISGRRRSRPLPEARMHAAVELLRAGLTLSQAGYVIKRDHTTVLYYRNKHAQESTPDPQRQADRRDPNVAEWLQECGL